ncbi:MAG: M50 family metallopeptidase, partial [Candidatus Sungiibacteriota bacterium]
MSIIFTIIFISALILVHEWGHFFAARRLGVRVEEFGFGFPPRLFSHIKNGVRYSFNLFPFGGFVKIFGEHGEGEQDRASFISRPAWQRFIILAAGVGMNVALAWVLFTAAAGIGLPQIADDTHIQSQSIPVSILGVVPVSPAAGAGLKLGDEILEMRGGQNISLRVENEEDVSDFVQAYRGEEITLIIRRSGAVSEIKAVPRAVLPDGEGPLGIALGRIVIERVPWYWAPIAGFQSLIRSTIAIAAGLWTLVSVLATTGHAPGEVSGPIGILLFARDSGALGIAYFLQFVGVLSVNLAVLNFLPIPALDGGRVLFLIIEKIYGRKISPHIEDAAHTAGFIALVLLMLLITYRDIVKIW